MFGLFKYCFYFCIMLSAYKYRIYPNKAQAELINKHIGACRFVYNLALETKNYAYASHKVNLSCFDLNNQLPELKKECEWLKEIDSQALQQSVVNLDKAFTQFFKGVTKFPNFKRKDRGSQSFRNPHGNKVKIENGKISIPKFKEGIKIIIDRTFKGEIKSNVISRTPTGKYFISILVDNKKPLPKKKPIKGETSIGIDLGLNHFIVTSDGLKVGNPRYLRNTLDRIKVLQRRLRNKKKGSNNKKKAYIRIAVLYEKATNQRKDFLHKLSTELVNSHDTLCLETLQISNMVKNHKFALSINDAGWGMFVDFCKYKVKWNGKNLLQIPTFESSTKICSCCGATNHKLILTDREWLCANCKTLHDRDENAAKVIKNYCLKTEVGNLKVPVEMLAIVKSMKQEKSTGR